MDAGRAVEDAWCWRQEDGGATGWVGLRAVTTSELCAAVPETERPSGASGGVSCT